MNTGKIDLPPGLTMDMLQKIAQFFSQEQSEQADKPSGTLPASQIRGVKKGYKYKFREYPKALTPPDVQITNEAQERTLRARWNTPLPWQEREAIEAYYAMVVYPKVMTPPQVVVNTQEEEDAMRASWGLGAGARASYPRWVFHAERAAQMVQSRDEEVALGPGWYPTPAEAVAAASPRAPSEKASASASERDELLDKARQMGITHNASWGTDRLRKAVAQAEKEALEAA